MFVDQRLRRHQREVRSVVWNVKKERFAGLPRLVDELQSELGPEKGGVPVLSEQGRVARDGFAIEVQWFLPALRQLAATREVLVREEHTAGTQVERAIEAAGPGW